MQNGGFPSDIQYDWDTHEFTNVLNASVEGKMIPLNGQCVLNSNEITIDTDAVMSAIDTENNVIRFSIFASLGGSKDGENTHYRISNIRLISDAPMKEANDTPGETICNIKAKKEYQFTDTFVETTSVETANVISAVGVTAVRDSEGVACTEVHFDKTTQRVFFELPECIDLTKYDSISVTADVPGQLLLEAYSDELNLNEDNWWVDSIFACYPYINGSVDGDKVRDKATTTFFLKDVINTDVENTNARYLAIGANKAPASGFGVENYLVYSVELESTQIGVAPIRLYSTEENTVEPSEPILNKVVIPEGDEYEFSISESNEADATKEKMYRTNVVTNEDGSVTFETTDSYNTGMVFWADKDKKCVDLSEFDFLEVTYSTTSSYDVTLKAFNDASVWWNKEEFFMSGGDGVVTERIPLASIGALNTSSVSGFGLGIYAGVDGEGIGDTVTIYSMKVVKE